MQIIALIESSLGNGLIVNLLFRRQGMVLAKLSEYYYKYFLHHPLDLFRNGIMGKLGFTSPYTQPISYVIGNNYETQLINCNNGLLADVWTNLGFLGLIIMPIILVICFRMFDLVSSQIDSRLIVSLSIYYAVAFSNSAWSTVLLTHGFIIMCFMLLIFPHERQTLA